MLTLVQAVNETLHAEMERDGRVIVLGEDVGVLGGVFRATAGLLDRFGSDRVFDTPLAEAGIVGASVGLAMAGLRPVCELQYDAFSYPALDQVLCHVGRHRWRSRGAQAMPLVIRIPIGGGIGAPELHQDSPEAHYVHAPGVKVVVAATPADAKGLLASAIRTDDPVVFLEPKRLYRAARADEVADDHIVPLGQARIARSGCDCTLIAYGAMVPVTLEAAEALAPTVDCEVIDLRSLKPLDEETILNSVMRTSRAVVVHEAPRTGGVGGEIAALLAERAMYHLAAPVLRVTGHDVPYPYWSLEHWHVPSVERVVDAVRQVLEP